MEYPNEYPSILNQILEKIGEPQIRFSVYYLLFKITSSLT